MAFSLIFHVEQVFAINEQTSFQFETYFHVQKDLETEKNSTQIFLCRFQNVKRKDFKRQKAFTKGLDEKCGTLI